MAPNKWDEDDSDQSTPPSSPPVTAARRGKFDDEEQDSDVVDSWDAEDSEVEREKAKKAAEAKAKEEAEKKASHKSAKQRRKEHIERRREEAEAGDQTTDDEDDAAKRARLRQEEKEGDLKHAEALFGDLNLVNDRSTKKAVTLADPNDPTNSIDLSSLPVFNPNTKDQFSKLRDTIAPLLTANSKKAHYTIFMQEFTKLIVKDLPSDQIKKIASGLTTLSNEKMKEEKAQEKGGKKSKAAKTKVTLNASRDISHKADTAVYEDGLDDGDFM